MMRFVATFIPLLVAIASTVTTAALLPQPSTTTSTVLWWVAVLGVGGVTSHTSTRLVTRLLPLAMLFELTLSFPDRAPSRYRLARDAWSVRRARAALESLHEATPAQRAAEAALALIAALDGHDRATRGHSERVRLLTELIARELTLSTADIDRLRWASLLHDLGKLAVHPDILNKQGKPTEEEWQILLRHPEEGAALARPLHSWLGPWALALAEHHERFDGTGYPHGLHGHDISLAGRIVAVADAYEAMTAHRAYNAPQSGKDARQELVAEAGTQFDPDVVRAFLRVSLPRRLRGPAPLAWVFSLPLVGWLRRLPTGGTVVATGSVVSAIALIAAGIAPGPSHLPPVTDPPVVAVPDDTPPDVRPSPGRDSQPEGVDKPPDGQPDEQPNAQPITAARPLQPPPVPSGEESGGSQPETGDDVPEGSVEPPPDSPPAERQPAAAAAHNAAVATTALYLMPRQPGDTDWQPAFDLSDESPPDGTLANFDHDRDEEPGLGLPAGEESTAWLRAYEGPTVIGGPVSVVVHMGAAGDRPDVNGTLHADLSVCDAEVRSCSLVATGSATSADWSSDGWTEQRIDLGIVAEVLPGSAVLRLTLRADTTVDLKVAFGTSHYPSRIDGLVAEPLTLLASAAALAAEATNASLIVPERA